MTTIQSSEILNEVNNLVSSSCFDVSGADSSFSSFHKGIVKLYFEARKVEIDYVNKIITAEIPVTATDFTTVSFECQDLERFLKSCIRDDKKSLMFYRNVLNYYSLTQVA